MGSSSFRVGDVVKIVENHSSHPFGIGALRKITRLGKSGNGKTSYYSNNGETGADDSNGYIFWSTDAFLVYAKMTMKELMEEAQKAEASVADFKDRLAFLRRLNVEEFDGKTYLAYKALMKAKENLSGKFEQDVEIAERLVEALEKE